MCESMPTIVIFRITFHRNHTGKDPPVSNVTIKSSICQGDVLFIHLQNTIKSAKKSSYLEHNDYIKKATTSMQYTLHGQKNDEETLRGTT